MAGIGEFQPVRNDTTGDLFLPASRRPDGTWRKPRRVREGYVPQEEVPVYESKGKQWAKSQPAYPVGMNPALVAVKTNSEKPSIPGLPATAAKQSNKKKKNSEKKVKAEVKEVTKALSGFTIQEPVFNTAPVSKTAKVPVVGTKTEVTVNDSTTATDPAKRLKNLKKKLKDIEALENKVKNGELKNPDKDQIEKIKRKKDVAKEINELENMIN